MRLIGMTLVPLFLSVAAIGCKGESERRFGRSYLPPETGGEAVSAAPGDQAVDQTTTTTTTEEMTVDKTVSGVDKSKTKAKVPLTAEQRREREGCLKDCTKKRKAERHSATQRRSDTEAMEMNEREAMQRAIRRAEFEKARCPDPVHGHPAYMRADLAYAIDHVDCHGDIPKDYRVAVDLPRSTLRSPASITVSEPADECSDDPHAHALWMRPDIATSVTGLDCFGDPPADSNLDLE